MLRSEPLPDLHILSDIFAMEDLSVRSGQVLTFLLLHPDISVSAMKTSHRKQHRIAKLQKWDMCIIVCFMYFIHFETSLKTRALSFVSILIRKPNTSDSTLSPPIYSKSSKISAFPHICKRQQGYRVTSHYSQK